MTLQDSEVLRFVDDNPWLHSLLLLVVFAVLAKLTDLVVTRGILKLTSRTRTEVDDHLVRLLHKPIFWTVVLIGIWYALETIVPATEDGRLRDLERVAGDLIKTVVVLLWTLFFIRASVVVLWSMSRRKDRYEILQPATQPLFETFTKVALVAIGVYFFFLIWEINVTAWIASAGIAAMALGLAAQETLANLFGGISIMADRPYQVGDYIVLDAGDRGVVTRIGLRSTRILTRDNIEVTIPNSVIAKSKIVNESGGPSVKQRLRIGVGVAYGSNIQQVKAVLLEAIENLDGVSRDQPAWVQFRAMADSSLNFEIRCWIDDPTLRGRVLDRINTAVYDALNAAGITIPFPQQDLYIKELPGSTRQ